jgi:hypothetical protein
VEQMCRAPLSSSNHHEYVLTYRNTNDWVTASVADDGRATLAHRDPECTAAEFAHAEDRSAYLAMLQRLGENMASIGGLLGSEVRSLALVRHLSGLVRRGGLRAAVTSGRAYLRRDFRGQKVDHLYAPWLLHAGLSPDHAAGALAGDHGKVPCLELNGRECNRFFKPPAGLRNLNASFPGVVNKSKPSGTAASKLTRLPMTFSTGLKTTETNPQRRRSGWYRALLRAYQFFSR